MFGPGGRRAALEEAIWFANDALFEYLKDVKDTCRELRPGAVVAPKADLRGERPSAADLGDDSKGDEEEDSALLGLAGGCCFDFSKLSEHLFLVGTEEGWIHKCSKAYNSEYLANYSGHYMAVYTVRWNPFHHKVFASCSADWTAKLWDHTTSTALLSFDLNVQVGDLAWSPWSSTTFAACTADGKVHVFDLNENKNEPYCEQKAVRKAKLTKVAFNGTSGTPIIAVGDDHGCVTTMKPSPNLRWTAVTKKAAEEKAKAEAEAAADRKSVV